MQQELEQAILQINNSYLDWSKVQDMHFNVPGYTNEALWESAMRERDQGFIRKWPLGSQVFSWSVSNQMESVLQELDVALAGGQTIHPIIEEKNKHRYAINALVDECMASAQLAGFALTKRGVKELLLKKKVPANQQEQVVVNLSRALNKLMTQYQEPLSEALLLELHQTLTRDTLKLMGTGRFRTNNKYDVSAWEGSAKVKAPDAKELGPLMEAFYSFFNEDRKPFYVHPIIKAGILQYLFTHIRPFRDGNGRMGRLLASWYLLKKGYWAVEYMAVSNIITKLKLPYQKTFVQVAENELDLGYFIHFYAQALRMSYKSLREGIQKTNKEKEVNPFVKIEGMNIRQAAALEWIREDGSKIITIRELRSGYGVSKETARTDLTGLVEKGWLQFYHLNKKTYAFTKGAAFDQLMHEKINHS